MDAFLAYARRFVPGFAQNIRGVGTDVIAHIESAAGVELPTFYRSFLEHMGANAAGLSLGYETELTASALTENVVVPGGCIALGVGGPAVDICLRPMSPHDGTVLLNDGVIVWATLAESLEKALFQRVFELYELPQAGTPFSFTVHNQIARTYCAMHGEPARHTLGAAAMRANFKPRPFSDEWTLCATRGDVALFVSELDGEGLKLLVAGASEEGARNVGEALASTIGAQRSAK